MPQGFQKVKGIQVVERFLDFMEPKNQYTAGNAKAKDQYPFSQQPATEPLT
jgi:hypothetical protein